MSTSQAKWTRGAGTAKKPSCKTSCIAALRRWFFRRRSTPASALLSVKTICSSWRKPRCTIMQMTRKRTWVLLICWQEPRYEHKFLRENILLCNYTGHSRNLRFFVQRHRKARAPQLRPEETAAESKIFGCLNPSTKHDGWPQALGVPRAS